MVFRFIPAQVTRLFNIKVGLHDIHKYSTPSPRRCPCRIGKRHSLQALDPDQPHAKTERLVNKLCAGSFRSESKRRHSLSLRLSPPDTIVYHT